MRKDLRRGFTLFQLLVVLAILMILFALLLPALAKARLAQVRAQATNNVKQLCLAMHNYHDSYGALPPGVDDNHFSVASKFLPFVEQDNLFKQIDFKKSIDDKANAEARKVRVKVFLSTADPVETVKPEWGATNYLFNDRLFFLNSKTNFLNITDGTSFTIALGETLKGDGMNKATDVKRQYVLLKKEDLKSVGPDSGVKYFKESKNVAGDRCASWMDGRFLQGTFNGKLRPNDERPDVSCGGVSGVSALRSLDDKVIVGMADGSARMVKDKISPQTWQAAITPAGGEVLGPDW
jgi:type II secretory pathway pseudopilin PulG